MRDSLSSLRVELEHRNLAGFLVPMNDEFMGEYIPDSAKRLTWLTGFTGSAGMAIVLKDEAAFFTDGRYTLQAKAEVAKGFVLLNNGDVSPEQWLAKHAAKDAIIGYDPTLHTLQSIRRFEQAARGIRFIPLADNPIDALWEDRPKPPSGAVHSHPLEFAGEASEKKRARMANRLTEAGTDAAILTASDSVCWLANIRGSDLAFTPFVLCYALLLRDSTLQLYLDDARVPVQVKASLGSGITLCPPQSLESDLAALAGKRVLYDPTNSPIWFYHQLKKASADVVESADPCVGDKARKNAVELAGTKRAHVRDGLAVTKFLCWLDGAVKGKKPLTEMDVSAKLGEFRKGSKEYREPSFTTIAGSGPNGAVVHYRVTEKTNRRLDKNSLLLLDSGGQYPDGTTDITRTVALGKPSAEMKDRFTRVLKGHIALARAVFPEGTTGAQLDSLARQFLWQVGLDYDHGTGHGVGSYLSVHEGPQRIGKRGGDATLAPGMILSNEPGYYKAGAYGIRIENLVVVKEASARKGKRFFGFETITLAPIDARLIDKKLLTREEAVWLNGYHKCVAAAHSGKLNTAEKRWLKQAARPL